MITLGCPKNEVDSGVLAGELIRGGMQLVKDVNEADIILINTCGFIENAKNESIKATLKAVELKKRQKGKKVYMWGCLSQRYQGEIEKEFPEVDGFFGVEPYKHIGRILLGTQYRWNKKAFENRILSTPQHVAYLKIADGCDHSCSFCAIPDIKGAYRSRTIPDILREAEALARRGVKELILIAQDTAQYGSDLGNSITLVRLLKKLIAIRSIEWIRIMYVHPIHITDELIDLIAECDKICRYIDMPIQHGSDPILRTMGRGMNRTGIEKLIEKIRRAIPDVTLRTAFIVGFPGETDVHFNELVSFIKRIRFERVGVFIFSPEEGTEAYQYEQKVSKSVAVRRFNTLMKTQQKISYQINHALLSRTLSVIVDGYDRNRMKYFGRTQGDCLEIDQTVWFEGTTAPGEIVSVLIEEASAYDLKGRIVPGLYIRR
jgi:ribosomal protein S12 methylthiotransferase